MSDTKSEMRAWLRQADTRQRQEYAAAEAARMLPFAGLTHGDLTEIRMLSLARAIISAQVVSQFDEGRTKAACESAKKMAENTREKAALEYEVVSMDLLTWAISATSGVLSLDAPDYDNTIIARRSHVDAMRRAQGSYRIWGENIWLDANPNRRAIQDLREYFATDVAKWRFWAAWYENLLSAEKPDWPLWHDIALIPDTDWQQGPAHIADRIRDIQTEHLSRRLPQAERIAFNAKTDYFYAIPREVLRPALHAAILSRVADTLDDVLADLGNGLRENGPEARGIRRAISQYGNDPQRIEMDFTAIHRCLTRQMAVGDLPPSEPNLLLDYALTEGAQSLRATLPEVAENRQILDRQVFKELTKEAVSVIGEAASVLIAITEGDLSQSLAEDTTLLLDPSMLVRPPQPTLGNPERNPVLAGYDEQSRLFGRTARILILLRKTPELIHKLDGTATVKGAKIVTTLAAIVMLGWGLVG